MILYRGIADMDRNWSWRRQMLLWFIIQIDDVISRNVDTYFMVDTRKLTEISHCSLWSLFGVVHPYGPKNCNLGYYLFQSNSILHINHFTQRTKEDNGLQRKILRSEIILNTDFSTVKQN